MFASIVFDRHVATMFRDPMFLERWHTRPLELLSLST